MTNSKRCLTIPVTAGRIMPSQIITAAQRLLLALQRNTPAGAPFIKGIGFGHHVVNDDIEFMFHRPYFLAFDGSKSSALHLDGSNVDILAHAEQEFNDLCRAIILHGDEEHIFAADPDISYLAKKSSRRFDYVVTNNFDIVAADLDDFRGYINYSDDDFGMMFSVRIDQASSAHDLVEKSADFKMSEAFILSYLNQNFEVEIDYENDPDAERRISLISATSVEFPY